MHFPAGKLLCLLLSVINAGEPKQWVDDASISLANMFGAW